MVYISALMLILINGCGGSDKLTDAELERIALAEKVELVESAGGFVLMVGGEPISSNDLMIARRQESVACRTPPKSRQTTSDFVSPPI